MSHSQGSLTNFANTGKSLDYKVIDLLAAPSAVAKRVTTIFQFVVRQFFDFCFFSIDLFDDGLDEFDVTLGRIEKLS